MGEEPSNFALTLSERIQEGEAFDLSPQELDLLTDYERLVLEKTAVRCGYHAMFHLSTGVVTLKKDYSA